VPRASRPTSSTPPRDAFSLSSGRKLRPCPVSAESVVAREMIHASLAWLLASGLFAGASLAQTMPYPAGSDISFQWSYSCPNGRGCSFSCPGRGGASQVTKLTIYLGKVRIGGDKTALATFYEFSTVAIPHGNGFAIETGLGTLTCQVNGMTLDYSGPPKSTKTE
jgi:hypothetical protein